MSRGFVIWDTTTIVGDLALFWRPNRSGYTTDLDKAGVYDQAEAERICSGPGGRSTDKAVPYEVAEAAANRTVDADSMRNLVAGRLADGSPRPTGFGMDSPWFRPDLCVNHRCACHTDKDHRVLTPFPDEALGNNYCCTDCARGRPQLAQMMGMRTR